MIRRAFLASLPAASLAVPFKQRSQTLEWFKQAKFGLFMHYGVYSILGRGEWVQLREAIPVKEYEKLKSQFTADKFDADRICAMAAGAGMKYVNLTARHHDSFCLFKTAQTDFSSMHAPARRDLIGELVQACRKHRLGVFFYYSYALDWRHPYFYPNEVSPWKSARPPYKSPEPSYLWKQDSDFRKYIDFTHAQIKELLTQYGPIEGMWFDPIMGYYARPDLFPIEETYALVRKLQPNCLICFKQGASGDEDFTAPERKKAPHRAATKDALAAWEKNKDKWGEICDTLQPGLWGYNIKDTGNHLDAPEVVRRLKAAQEQGCNLLMNTGPLPDGSIHAEDVKTLAETGRLLGE